MKTVRSLMFCLLAFPLAGCVHVRMQESDVSQGSGESDVSQGSGESNEASEISGEPAASFIDYQEVLDAAPEGLEQINQGDYDNLNFEDAVLAQLSGVSGLYELELTNMDTQDFDTFLAKFEDAVRALWGDDTEEQYFYIATSSDEKISGLVYPKTSMSDAERFLYPELYENLEIIREKNIDIAFLMYETDLYGNTDDDKYLLAFNDMQLIKLVKSELMRTVDQERALAGWMPRDNFSAEKVYTSDSDDVYTLKDGECAVRDAAEFAEEYFNEKNAEFPFNEFSELKVKVNSVMPIETESGVYAYYFYLSRAYEGVSFDAMNQEGIISGASDGNEYNYDNSEALMYYSDAMEYYYFTSMSKKITSKTEISRIIPLESAAQFASDHLSGHLIFDVQSIDFVYSNRVTDSETKTYTARPAWKFEMYCSNNGKVYCVLVDAETGETYHYSY